MNDWDWDNYDFDKYVNPHVEQLELPQVCQHEWKGILLLRTTVYNCAVCDIKKEEYERTKV
jgi:hypothetical protein